MVSHRERILSLTRQRRAVNEGSIPSAIISSKANANTWRAEERNPKPLWGEKMNFDLYLPIVVIIMMVIIAKGQG